MNSFNFFLVCLLIISVIASVSSFHCCHTTYISPQPSEVDVICSNNFNGCMMFGNEIRTYIDSSRLDNEKRHTFQPNTTLLFKENQIIIKYYEYILRPPAPVEDDGLISPCMIERLISNAMIDLHYHVMMGFPTKSKDSWQRWIYWGYE